MTRFITPFGLVVAWMLAIAFCFLDHACAQQTGYDGDTQLDFVWTPAEGSFDHYNAYVSVDGVEYQLDGTSSTEACTVVGQNGHTYRIKVSAVTSEGTERPSSPESDPVICDTLAPLSPVISDTYDVLDQSTVVLSLDSSPSDAHFSNCQVFGGQHTDWIDISGTAAWAFSVVWSSQNALQMEEDFWGNVERTALLIVENMISGRTRTGSEASGPWDNATVLFG